MPTFPLDWYGSGKFFGDKWPGSEAATNHLVTADLPEMYSGLSNSRISALI